MPASEWDVFALPPNGSADPPTYLATLSEAREKTIRIELDGTGSGALALNHLSPECTEAVMAQGNVVKVRIPEIHSDYIFTFFLETGDFTLISSDEVGGEMLHFGGRGALCYLEHGVAWAYSYIAGGQSPRDGVWRAYLAGTGHKPGQILMRMIEEMQDPDRPQHPIPQLTPDFDYTLDSNGEAWIDPNATDEFSYQVGEDGLAIVTRLIPTGVTLQMDPDFALHAYNSLGRDLTGAAFGAGVVRFVKGVNIATELRRELQPSLGKTHELVAGEKDKYGRGVLPGASAMVTKETYLAAFGTNVTALNAMGVADLKERAGVSDTIMFPIANRRTASVVLVDPVSIGGTLGPGADEGFYLPGPPGSDHGDFWVGDYVIIHTGAGPFDYNEQNARVMAITITRDDDNGELIVIPELQVFPVPSCDLGSVALMNSDGPVNASIPSGPGHQDPWSTSSVASAPSEPSGLVLGFISNFSEWDAVSGPGPTGPGIALPGGSPWSVVDANTFGPDLVLGLVAAQPIGGTPDPLAFILPRANSAYYVQFASIRTASTGPVQVKYTPDVGTTLTLGAAPTQGNILVLCFLDTLPSQAPVPPMPIDIGDWHIVENDTFGSTGPVVNGRSMILMRCAGAGESATIGIPSIHDTQNGLVFYSEWLPG